MKTTLTTQFQRWPMLFGLAMLLLALPAPAQTDEFQLHGRISFDSGNVVLKAASGDEWAQGAVNTLVMPGDTLWVDQEGSTEVEMAGGSFLRLADASKAEVLGLPPSASIRGWVGSFYVQRTARSQGTFIFSTPAATVDIPSNSSVRMDVGERGDTVVTVRWGSAGVRSAAGGAVSVPEGRRVWVDPGMLPSDPVVFDRLVTDAFDQWNNDRARLLAEGLKTLPREVAVTTPAIGVSDLGQYGEWVYVDSRPYWRPTVVVNYVPYRYGRWNHVPAYGHVWVDAYPFSYVTSHYGRWRHTSGYGWVWGWDPVWSPAWVTTVAVGDYFMWAPMDYYNRPVLVAGASYFSIGGVSFCAASTSYMSYGYISRGYAPVYPVNTVVINTFTSAPVNQINIWNININTGGRGGRDYRRPQTALDTSVFTVRDYTPQRSIRGIPADAGLKGPAPVERARTLEARLGREQFSPADRGGVRKERSAAPAEQARGVPARSVRLANTEARQPVARDAARIAAPGADTVKDRASVRGDAVPDTARRAPDRTPTLNNESAVPPAWATCAAAPRWRARRKVAACAATPRRNPPRKPARPSAPLSVRPPAPPPRPRQPRPEGLSAPRRRE